MSSNMKDDFVSHFISQVSTPLQSLPLGSICASLTCAFRFWKLSIYSFVTWSTSCIVFRCLFNKSFNSSLVWNMNGFFFSWIDIFSCNSEITWVTFEWSSSLHELTLCVSSDLVSTWILHHMKCTEKVSFLHELSCVISIDIQG